VSWVAFAGVFGLIFLVELPDKTVVATMVMSARGRPAAVFAGSASALVVQMGLAAVAGGLLATLPGTPKTVIISIVFLAGAAYLLFVPEKRERARGELQGSAPLPPTVGREALTAFGVIFVAEFGDLSQVQAANLAARTHDAPVVFVAAALAVVVVAALAAYAGQWLVGRIPLAKIRFVAGVIFAAFGVYGLARLAT
jgi:Ca2+/H+ antiporter, TMEM165/GDT1 family